MKLEWSKTKPHLNILIDYLFGGEIRGSLLQIGCGNGSELFLSARGVSSIYGVDDSSDAIKQAKKKAELSGIPAKLQVANPDKLPFKSGMFNAVYSSYYLEEYNLKKAIPEIARVLKKGGYAYLVMGWRDMDLRSGDLLVERFSLNSLKRLFRVHGLDIVYQDEKETIVKKKKPGIRHVSVRFILEKR